MVCRRSLLAGFAVAAAKPSLLLANAPRTVTWDDLIPPGVSYPEIIGQGDIDEVNDTWSPIFDENAKLLNDALNGAYIRMPGYIIPFELTSDGVTEFMLVPYVGACIHVPPPPPNQLVYVKTTTPWPDNQLWEAVWVTGIMATQTTQTELAEVGYALQADQIDVYEW